MKLEEFLQEGNAVLIDEAKKCKTVEELEAFAKANDLELTKEDLEAMKLRFQEGNVLLSDDKLDSVAGGKWEQNDSYGIKIF